VVRADVDMNNVYLLQQLNVVLHNTYGTPVVCIDVDTNNVYLLQQLTFVLHNNIVKKEFIAVIKMN